MKIDLKISPKFFIRYYWLYAAILMILSLSAASKYLYDKVYLTVIDPSFDLSSEELEYSSLDLSMKKFNTVMEKIEAKNKSRYYSEQKDIFN